MLLAEMHNNGPRSTEGESDVHHLSISKDRIILSGKWWAHLRCEIVAEVPRRTMSGEQQWTRNGGNNMDSALARVVQPSSSVSRERRAVTQIREWLRICKAEHTSCREASDARNERNVKPIRLIYVGSTSDPTIRLISTEDLGYWPTYTTLSHRWTDATQKTQLTWKNIKQFRTSIDTTSWPMMYIHGLQITRELGINYIWIDSVCIVQDLDGNIPIQDWDEQSRLMDYIYARGVLNLATLGAEKLGGLLNDHESLANTPCIVSCQDQNRQHYMVYREEHICSAVDSAPLAGRGWVFQERILSRRAAHFGTQVYWDCASLQACETFPDGYDRSLAVYSKGDTRTIKAQLQDDNKSPRLLKHLHEQWLQIVESYTGTQLTVLSDRLIALRGIVNAFAQRHSLPLTSYAAGMWEFCLPEALLWRPQSKRKDESREELLHHFASWSWASHNGSVTTPRTSRNTHRPLAAIVQMQSPDNKLMSSDPANILLHGSPVVIDNPGVLQQDDVSDQYKGVLEVGEHVSPVSNVNNTGFYRILVDDIATPMTPKITLLPLYEAPFERNIFGLLIQQAEYNDNVTPTYRRLGTYRLFRSCSADVDPNLSSGPLLRLV